MRGSIPAGERRRRTQGLVRDMLAVGGRRDMDRDTASIMILPLRVGLLDVIPDSARAPRGSIERRRSGASTIDWRVTLGLGGSCVSLASSY